MGENRCAGDDGYPLVDLDSDNECGAESSDDEIDVILRGTPEQKRRLRRLSLGLQSSSSEDEFEKEMAQELNRTMDNIKQKHNMGNPGQSSKQKSGKPGPNTFYDNNYFDSDSDEEGTSQEKTSIQHPVISNDDLLYDPNIDEDNQQWVDKQRQQYQPAGRNKPRAGKSQDPKKANVKPLPHSDAVLNCPACMTVLCLDCQRHSSYKNQYRAMFVQNCQIENEEVLRYPTQSGKKGKKKNKNKRMKTDTVETDENTPTTCQTMDGPTASGSEPMEISESDADNVFNPVKCTICKTEVGVYDKDEVYHFFNVLASYA